MMATNFNSSETAKRRAIVLVVEDEPLLRYALASELSEAGFQVVEAANTDEAETVLATGSPVDVLITDVQMPGPRDGMVLAEIVRTTRPTTKIIVASGRPPQSNVATLADAFFSKPYDLDRVIRDISSMVGSHQNA